MANKNFSDFAQRTTGLLDSDFIVGYDAAGPLEFRTTIGNLLSGGTASPHVQYSIWMAHATSGAMTDAATYYFGQMLDLGLVTSPNASRSVYMGGTGTIKYASVALYAGSTLGTAEAATLSIENITATTSSVVSNSIVYNATNAGALYTLATPMKFAQGDQLTMKITCPTWATNPSSSRMSVNLYAY